MRCCLLSGHVLLLLVWSDAEQMLEPHVAHTSVQGQWFPIGSAGYGWVAWFDFGDL